MCGIAGILNFDSVTSATETTVARMMSSLRHRGPDESGIFRDRDACLGHVRLSILGLSRGIQPIGTRDETLWIVYNGEAFNYLELKEELVAKGYRFSTDTDTEIVLALYREYGAQCLNKINGQFAFAIWDSRKRELFLARDRVGIRPLFYHARGGAFRFASEIKALFCDPEVQRTVDPRALQQVFTFWTTITPNTVFDGVYELPPGHFLRVGVDGPGEPQAYWQLPYCAPEARWRGSFGEAREELHALLKDAVRLRLRADVPVGAYLSGGLDSSITTALVAENFNNHLRTFSLGFQENPFDESDYQNDMVSALGTEHSEMRVTNRHIRENFPRVVRQCEKPLLRAGPVPLFSLSELVRDSRFKVVLTGEGADEVFGGYNIYKEAKLRQLWARRPDSKWLPPLFERLYPYIFKNPARGRTILQRFFAVTAEELNDPFFSHQVRWRTSGKNNLFFSGDLQQQLNGFDPLDALRHRLPEGFAGYDPFSKAQFLEMDVFLSNYLLSSQGDRVAMSHSIELRLPFLDFRVIEFAARLPAQWKLKGLNEKYILKEAFKDLVPENIRNRAKQPYRAPIREAFRTDDPGSYVQQMLAPETIDAYGYFEAKKVGLLSRRFYRESQQATTEGQNMALIGILSTQLLHQQFIEDFDPGEIEPLQPERVVRK